jgi:signal transduction histidine kinase
MKKLMDCLIGNEEKYSFEKRVYNLCVLLGSALTLIGILIDWFSSSIFIIYSGLFVLIWLAAYYFTKVKGYYKGVMTASIVLLVTVFFPMNWLTSAGIQGIIPYYSILFIAITCIVTSGKTRLALVGTYIVIQTLLILYGGNLDGGSMLDPLYQQLQMNLLIHLTVITVSIAFLIIMYSITYRNERARSDAYSKTIGENYHQQLYYMENLEQLVTRLRAERHDFNNQLGIIYGMLEDDEIVKAKEYAATLVGAARAHQNMVTLPYSMLRAMINYKLSVASEKGIRLNLSVDVRAGLAFNEPDLAIIIGTLLDNAVEACQQAKEKTIGLNLYYKPDYLILRVENAVGPDVMMPSWMSGQGKSNKTDPENHGFGLRNVKYLVEKHSGLIEIDMRKNNFKVNIALLVDAKEAS